MNNLSKIPLNVNKYMIRRVSQIRNEPVEYLKLLDFKQNKIVSESKFVKGLENEIPDLYKYAQRDLFGHNHPSGRAVFSPSDVKASLKLGFKKIYVSSKEGFSSIDFTTAKKDFSNRKMFDVIKEKEVDALAEMMENKVKNAKNSVFNFFNFFHEYQKQETNFAVIFKRKLVEFAKETGVTLSEVKWSDYKR